MGQSVNIAIVHYNTPFLTKYLVKSIKKFTPNSKIYIFDNSDVAPFDTTGFDNITIFDNTKGQYIDFDKWLEKYPNKNKSAGRLNKWGSAKHCVSVEKLMSLIDGGFILLDSDVLIKKDISELAAPQYAYVGEVVNQPKSTIRRVLPYICYINAELCKSKNIHYFDENRMHGLWHKVVNSDADYYDTGAAFFINASKLPSKNIKTNDYVVHFSGGSWSEQKGKKYKYFYTPKQWISKYANCWSDGEKEMEKKNKKVVYTCITGNYEPLDDPFVVSEGFDYICFTDSTSIKSDIWKIRPISIDLNGLPAVKKQRCIKINPHKYLKGYDLSVWVDGSVKLTKDLNEFIDKECSGEESVYIPRHPQRKCIYAEMTACIQIKKDTEANIAPQKRKYLKEGFPKNYGLVQSNIIIRRHNDPACIKLMETWWTEVRNGSHRDQLSFDYARWKNQDVKVKFLDKNTCQSPYFKWDKLHGKGKKDKPLAKLPISVTDIVGEFAVKSKNTKPARAPKKPAMKPVTITNPTLRKKIISERLKVFLRP